MDTKKCPFCGEEILAAAKKCKHCGEWLEEEADVEIPEENNADDSKSFSFDGRGYALIYAGIGWALFHFGSWHLVLGKKLSSMQQFFSSMEEFLSFGKWKMQDFIVEDCTILIRINEKYYGFVTDNHFFDSPFIQWGMLAMALGAFYYAIKVLIFGND
ncbi:MAG: zinc ribbon domain-containing protein [Prevotellaceae bacterium]|jgi:hypothetical protein|nr:zinc ribbon domain-containing protein [Prevotellaceae bacterium]